MIISSISKQIMVKVAVIKILLVSCGATRSGSNLFVVIADYLLCLVFFI